jgi:predicted amidohydrolase YtcJ
MTEKIDLILYNGDIRTLDPNNPQAGAIAIGDGRVVAVGSSAEIHNMVRNSSVDSYDLKKSTVVPGFNDSHTHFAWWSQARQRVDVHAATSLDHLVEMVRERAQATPKGSWVRGFGWDKLLWGGSFPTKESLDRAIPDHPVVLTARDGHLMWVNSKAMELVGVTRDTPDPAGGEIERDAKGEATGIFKENAMHLFRATEGKLTIEEAESYMLEAMETAHQLGVTGLHSIEDSLGFAALQELHAKNKLKLRTTVLLTNTAIPHLTALGLRQGFGDEMLWLGQIKFFLDGTLGSQTAAMFEPFDHSPDCNCGILRMDIEDFEKQTQQAVEAGFGIAVHVIGDRAARIGIEAIEKLRANNPHARVRHRLEHVQIFKPEDMERIVKAKIIASVQPTHCTSDIDNADKYWGARASHSYQYKSMLNNGVRLALGSDVPIESIDPRKGVFAAVTRRREGDNRPSWYPQECLTVEEAVEGFTKGAAFAAGDEFRRGLIAPGYLADFTALAQNVFSTNQDEIPVTPVTATFVGGVPVYQG